VRRGTLSPRARHEELANALTHGLGVLAGLTAGAALVVLAAHTGDPWRIVGTSIFVATLVGLYTASTLYHAIPSARWKVRLRTVDHAAIYLLIAGTYTPFTLSSLRGGWGWSLFGVVWGLAVAGVAFKILLLGRFPRLSTTLYVAMGWLVLVAAVPLVQRLSPLTLIWLVAGGVCYTAGTAFYHTERIPYAHAVWHLFVLAGSACHGVAVATDMLGVA
jgi:hemolysin III